MPWDESRHVLGVAEMDATHRQFVELADALPGWFATHLATMDSALAACLRRG